MNNRADSEDTYDYWPNELAELSINNNAKYRQIVESNLESDDTVEAWEQRNLQRAKQYLDGNK